MLLLRHLPAAMLGVAFFGVLSGCAPAPESTPTPTTLFMSDEEAFAAAEKVYRAYNDAVNAQRAGDESADPSKYLIGDALEADIDSDQLIAEQGWTLVGDGQVSQFSGVAADRGAVAAVSATACLDVSNTLVLDERGIDVTPPDRPTRVLLALRFIQVGSGIAVAESEVAENSTC